MMDTFRQCVRVFAVSLFILIVFVAAGCGKTTQKDPVVSSFSPESGLVGTEVTLTGSRFDTTPANNIVRFNKVQASVVSATATQLVVTVPSGATSGTITVTTSNGTGGSAKTFFVTELIGGSVQGFSPSLSGAVSTVAGNAGASGFADGVGSAARFNTPYGVTNDGFNLYITDRNNNAIRRMNIATGSVTTIAGSTSGQSGSADGTGSAARFNSPSGITTDGTNLYVCDTSNHTIRQIVIATGQVTTVAGFANSPNYFDGTGSAARFNSPSGITTDGANLYVSDTGNHTIRQIIIASKQVITIAGTATRSGFFDGTGTQAQFNQPGGITTDGTSLFIADRGNNALRSLFISSGLVATIANSSGFAGITDGNALTARFNLPTGITSDGVNLYIADFNNQTIREYIPSSLTVLTPQVTTLAGMGGQAGSADNTGSQARFNNPSGITVANTGIYIADSANHTIRLLK